MCKVLRRSVIELSFLRDVTVAVSVGQRLVYSLILDRNVPVSFSFSPFLTKLFAMEEQVSRQQETGQ